LFRLARYTARFDEFPNLKEFPGLILATNDKGLPVCTGHLNSKKRGGYTEYALFNFNPV
jgi:hypothetical protein